VSAAMKKSGISWNVALGLKTACSLAIRQKSALQ
jgi:hypothetical protein